MEYTEKMGQGFRSAHGFGYEDYRMRHDLLIKVEKRRQADYEKERLTTSLLESQLRNNI
ncbi:hypothetical protein ACFOZY_13240 [Chungangia koreensis]|uniref:Uncharacterized protein n=1 Tax=Chungangia koreensis TaxID=752657 RepID=A0ABV8X9T0_9LACT